MGCLEPSGKAHEDPLVSSLAILLLLFVRSMLVRDLSLPWNGCKDH